MPTKKAPTHANTRPNPAHSADAASPALRGANSQTVYKPSADVAHLLSASIRFFTTRSDGWLRVVPTGETGEVFYKWKFTGGRCAGRYCMFVAESPEDIAALDGLRDKVESCDMGVHKCVRDSYYQQ